MVKREDFGNRLEKTRETSEHSKAQREKNICLVLLVVVV